MEYTENREKEEYLIDCPNNNFSPTILPHASRIIAIGDIHGDLELAINTFKFAKLIDDKHNWIAEPLDTVVVQVGDQIDSCRPLSYIFDCQKTANDKAEDMLVIEFFDTIHDKARKYGGAVYSLLGNHELMNVNGNFSYVSFENLDNFSFENYHGREGRKNAFKQGGPIATKLGCTRPSIIIIGDTMFAHAGIMPSLIQNLEYLNMDNRSKIRYLNLIVRRWLLNKMSESEKKLSDYIINDQKDSPFWTRIYGMIKENTDINSAECENSVGKILNIFKVGHLVVGHTPQISNGINGTCCTKSIDSKLYRIDSGGSRAFNNVLKQVRGYSYLEIIGSKFKIYKSTDN